MLYFDFLLTISTTEMCIQTGRVNSIWRRQTRRDGF